MTRYEPVTFADVKVGDKVKSVSPCGTVRKGVVFAIEGSGYCVDSERNYLTRPGYTLYRRTPKPPKFVPLDVPEVGQWIEATLRNGRVEDFEVVTITDEGKFWSINEFVTPGRDVCLPKPSDDVPIGRDITSWRPITPPAPPEPTGFGYVGFVTTESDVWHVSRRRALCDGYVAISVATGQQGVGNWKQTHSTGTFTAVTK